MRNITTKKGVELLVPEKGERHRNAGRPKGAKNVMTRTLAEAILLAAAENPIAEKNGGGLVGYFKHLAIKRPDLVMRLLAKLMVMEEKERAKSTKRLDRPVEPVVYETAEEFRAALAARGITRDMLADLLVETPSNVIDGQFKNKAWTIKTITMLLEQWTGDDVEEIIEAVLAEAREHCRSTSSQGAS